MGRWLSRWAWIPLAVGCAATDSAPPDAPDTEAEVSEGGGVSPELGDWRGTPVAFRVTEQGIESLAFEQLSCDGIRPDSAEACTGDLTGVVVPPQAIAISAAGFAYTDNQFLTVVGQFDDATHSSGLVVAEGLGGRCCSATAAWTAVAPSEADTTPGETGTCGESMTDRWKLELGTMEGDQFHPLVNDMAVPVVPGVQGAIMIVVTLRATGHDSKPGSALVTVDFDDTGARGEELAVNSPFQPAADSAAFEWRSIWVVIRRPDGGLLTPFDDDVDAYVSDTNITIRGEILDTCGVVADSEIHARTTYNPVD